MTRERAGQRDARQLSAFDLGCVVVGGIIGVGIFFTPAAVARRVDSAGEALAAWAIAALLAGLGGLVFADLSARLPGHGGIFRYVHAAFGAVPAFLFGWANWLVVQAGALAVVALLCVEHVERALVGAPVLSADARAACAVLAILLTTATNVFGLAVGKRVQNALTVLKVAALLLLVVAAAKAATGAVGASAPAEPVGGSLASRIGGALLPALFAIGGWQQGSFVAGAARRPRRDVPAGILGGVFVVVLVYLLIQHAYVDLLGFAGARQSAAVGADAARAALGAAGERAFALMVAVSALGIMNTICLAPPYVLVAMAQHGLLPAGFARLHERLGSPVLATLAQGLWAALLLMLVHVAATRLFLAAAGERATLQTLDFVCDSVVFVDWTVFMLCGLAALRLRRRGPGPGLPAPGLGLVAALFALGALGVACAAVTSRPWPSLVGFLLVLLGVPGFFVLARGRSRIAAEDRGE